MDKPKMAEMLDSLPILPLRNAVLFPALVMPLVIGREKTLRLLESVNEGQRVFGVVTQKDKEVLDPAPVDMYRTGTTASSAKLFKWIGQKSK